MRVHLGGDHAAFELKAQLAQYLTEQGFEIVDHGPATFDPDDDYPTAVIPAAVAVLADQKAGIAALGIVLGGSGNGEQIAANKVPGIRAALAWSVETATLGRQHNDAQVVAIGARMHSAAEAKAIAEAFVTTDFSQNPRHQRRLDQVAEYEKSHTVPAAGVAQNR